MLCCGTSTTLEPMQWSLILMQVSRGRLFADWSSCWEPMSWPMPALSATINTPSCTQLGQRRCASRVGQVATNSNILHGSKAHVCEVTSLFHHALDTDDFGADGDHDRPFHRTYCDMIKIKGSCGGPLQHAIWLKQVQSTGVRMWTG